MVIVADKHIIITHGADQAERTETSEQSDEYQVAQNGAAECGCYEDMWDLLILDLTPAAHLFDISLYYDWLGLVIWIHWSLILFIGCLLRL